MGWGWGLGFGGFWGVGKSGNQEWWRDKGGYDKLLVLLLLRAWMGWKLEVIGRGGFLVRGGRYCESHQSINQHNEVKYHKVGKR